MARPNAKVKEDPDRGSFHNPVYEEFSGAPYVQNSNQGENAILPLGETDNTPWSAQAGGRMYTPHSAVSPEYPSVQSNTPAMGHFKDTFSYSDDSPGK